MDVRDIFRSVPWKRRPCICGAGNWELCDHGANQFRGHPSKAEAYSQWIRENLPASNAGVAHLDDDHVLANYRGQPLGHNTIISLKTHQAKPGALEKNTMKRHLVKPVRCAHLTLYNGNTPGHLKHFPVADDYAPEQPRLAEHITWQEQDRHGLHSEIEVSESELIAMLLDHWWGKDVHGKQGGVTNVTGKNCST